MNESDMAAVPTQVQCAATAIEKQIAAAFCFRRSRAIQFGFRNRTYLATVDVATRKYP